MIAARLKTTMPELTEPSERGDRLHWAVAAIPRIPGGLYGPSPELVWHGVEAQPGQACVHCLAFGVLGTCPGLHHHMTRAVRRLRKDGRKVVFGAFPVPVDADPHGPAATDALRRARTATSNVWVDRLSIT
ncbi:MULTISPECIES: hypothetical protein [Saccharothrix]|uniref:hypothetical protein n=1 Tax=Saccharothrix TaxID=2071 RepID=UPI00093D3ACA|nr:hypothetical protein [Saccharothrix sp. CB00851]OKI35295.1 hypothetical protein A6A25_24460 [Saccharothrix sp. CB00851]